jgi:hypothetical protein
MTEMARRIDNAVVKKGIRLCKEDFMCAGVTMRLV